jgi:hypothetical protein
MRDYGASARLRTAEVGRYIAREIYTTLRHDLKALATPT